MSAEEKDLVKKPKAEWRTPANYVTFTRIILIPVFVVVILSPWQNLFQDTAMILALKPWIAAIVFAVLALTDGIDGYLARSRNEVTTMGKFLDPIADKLLVVAALLALIQLDTLPSWIALIIIAREFLVSGLRMIAASEGLVIAASWVGKWKTAVSIVAIIAFIVKGSIISMLLKNSMATAAAAFNVFAWIIMIAALILTIVSMIDYFAKTISLFTGTKEEIPAGPENND